MERSQISASISLPDVHGPIAANDDSYPWLAAGKITEPVDLSACGYAEEEYFLSGFASVYDWLEDGDVAVLTAEAPYTNRILLRRPLDPARCSGRVIVEVLNASAGHDNSGIWSIFDCLAESGDIYVGVTTKPLCVKALKRFNPQRYAPLSWANPSPDPAFQLPPDSSHDTEDGLVWDILSQTGTLLKSGNPSNPLGFPAGFLYMYGGSQSGTYMLTYINAFHQRTCTRDGKPLYDGYLIDTGAGRIKPIRQYAAAPKMGTPRTLVCCSAPVINIVPEGDANAFEALKVRREDGDDEDDHYRMYEIAGCVHASGSHRNGPSTRDLETIGAQARDYTGETPVNDFPKHIFVKAALANLDRWVREGIPAPKGERLEIVDTDSLEPDMFPERYGYVVKDEHGNAKAGVRSPYVDVPVCTYVSWHTPRQPIGIPSGYNAASAPAARTFVQGHKIPFSGEKLKALYGDRHTYLKLVNASVVRLVSERWILPQDGDKIMQDAERFFP